MCGIPVWRCLTTNIIEAIESCCHSSKKNDDVKKYLKAVPPTACFAATVSATFDYTTDVLDY
jgi:hypothetical protein